MHLGNLEVTRGGYPRAGPVHDSVFYNMTALGSRSRILAVDGPQKTDEIHSHLTDTANSNNLTHSRSVGL